MAVSEDKKVLLAAVNAKYIHSNLAVYSLKRYAMKQGCREPEIGEYTINQQPDDILGEIYKRRAQVVAFSCYLWNIDIVRQVAAQLKKVQPGVEIWAGGPEVSYHSEEQLSETPYFDVIMCGEGERTFSELVKAYESGNDYRDIPGIVWRENFSGKIISNPQAAPLSMDDLPFAYPWLVKDAGMEDVFGELLPEYRETPDFSNKIIYYETSRGCPFSCSYCLSSIEKGVRLRSIEKVKRELDVFLKLKIPQVKFIDRTFNCNKGHSLDIWRYMLEHDNGITNFHFEIASDILSEEEMELLEQMRPGLVQLEIGVQSTHPPTVAAINRKMDFEKVARNVARIYQAGNIHQHLDLIAGLPEEDFETFCHSFDDVYRLHPDQLQLGFLKVLKGAPMEKASGQYQIAYRDFAPYEVLMTHKISYEELLTLKQMEEMLEVYYNSGQFTASVYYLESFFERPCELYLSLAAWYEKRVGFHNGVNRLKRYEYFLSYFKEEISKEEKEEVIMKELLLFDLYLRENLKSRPSFANDPQERMGFYKGFYETKELVERYLSEYSSYNYKQQGRMTHLEGICRETLEILEKCRKERHYTGRFPAVISPEELWDKKAAEERGIYSCLLFYY